MQRVVAEQAFLSKLTISRINKRKLLLDASSQQIEVLVEIATNICKGRFELTSRQIRKLKPFALFIRSLCNKKSVLKAKELLLKGDKVFAPLIHPVLKYVKIFSRPGKRL